jgi:hypothetical protein
MGLFGSKPSVDASKGQVDDDGRTFYVRGDGSGVAENTRVKLSDDERSQAQSYGEVEVRRGNREITVSGNDDGTTEVGVVYYDND